MTDRTRHTVEIADAVDMWSKLAWDIDVFRDIQTSYPAERQPIAYAAINVCIAAQSMYDWVTKELEIRDGTKFPNDKFSRILEAAVPAHKAMRDIANTSKHRDHRVSYWEGGSVDLRWVEGDEDVPGGYHLYHCEVGRTELALEQFECIKTGWWRLLLKYDLTGDRTSMPDWHTNKLSRLLGARVSIPDRL